MKLTDINDYVDEVAEKFPELPKNEVKRILVYGWKQILQYVSQGNDIQVTTPPFFFFIGRIPNNGLDAFKKYCAKLSKRIRFMFKRTKSKWDGYYYFTRSETQYIEYLKQKRKKYKVFQNVYLYKLFDEVKVAEPSNPYIFRLAEDSTDRMFRFFKEIKTDKAELVMVRDSMKMDDLLVSQNKYKYIQ